LPALIKASLRNQIGLFLFYSIVIPTRERSETGEPALSEVEGNPLLRFFREVSLRSPADCADRVSPR